MTPDGDLLVVDHLSVASTLGTARRAITTDINLRVGAGETVGIVGESGSGKSIAARAIMGLLPQGLTVKGSVLYRDQQLLGMTPRQIGQVRGTGISMIFQDPFTMLNPLMRCGDHIVELLKSGSGHRLSRSARRTEAIRRLDEVGIRDRDVVDAYPFQLSGGMRQRVGIAAALARDPELLIADEPTTALDVTTQRAILSRLRDLQESRGMGLVLITHDLRVAFSMCDRVEVLYAGSVLERGTASSLSEEPLHPYTLGLLRSEPPADRRVGRLDAIAGSVPDPDDVAGQCAFAPRCSWQTDTCLHGKPALAAAGPQRESACVRLPEIRDALRGESHRIPEAEVPQADRLSGNLVSVIDVAKTFRSRHGRTVNALNGVSLEVRTGESVGIVGESGSGKTTLGRCLVGLERPTRGQIIIDGHDVSDFERMPTSTRRSIRRTVQMIFQDPYSTLNPMRTISATLKEAVHVAEPDAPDTAGRIDELLDLVSLPRSYGPRKPIALSGGERQRVGIARALAMRPKLIVCDEAVSALDVSVQAQILNLLNELRTTLGISYVFITHDLAVVRQVADRVYVLRDGALVEHADTDQLLDAPRDPYTKQLIASIPRADSVWLSRDRVTDTP